MRIFVVQPVFHVITADLPSSFQVPTMPSPRLAFAFPSPDSVISKSCPVVSFTFHTPSNALAARLLTVVIARTKTAARTAAFAFPIVRIGVLLEEQFGRGP
ncbi:MAG TPA: hypothetical protein DCQ79_07580 [Rhizobiales bacterium]|nr:hypothetical protein [Hyphomicrobiales bacterium]